MTAHLNTFTGRRLDLLSLNPEDIDITDIAHALSQCNRFAGHTTDPISVAQHSIWVSNLSDPGHQLQGLLHDGAEAYLGDMTKWLKTNDDFYQQAEEYVQRRICARFDVPYELHPSVEAADRLMVRWEAWMGGLGCIHPDYPEPSGEEKLRLSTWRFCDWRRARDTFLNKFRNLYKRK